MSCIIAKMFCTCKEPSDSLFSYATDYKMCLELSNVAALEPENEYHTC